MGEVNNKVVNCVRVDNLCKLSMCQLDFMIISCGRSEFMVVRFKYVEVDILTPRRHCSRGFCFVVF